MAKVEKIAIQTKTLTCSNHLCKTVFTATRDEFIPQGCLYDGNVVCHHQYLVRCPVCQEANLIDDPEFSIRYVTPGQLKKEKRMAIATKIHRETVSLFKEIGRLFDRIIGLN